jgi:hypothetical protein
MACKKLRAGEMGDARSVGAMKSFLVMAGASSASSRTSSPPLQTKTRVEKVSGREDAAPGFKPVAGGKRQQKESDAADGEENDEVLSSHEDTGKVSMRCVC